MTTTRTHQLRFGCAEFRPENRTIRLYYSWPQYYEIDLDDQRLNLEGWIEHLTASKHWADKGLLRDLRLCWAAASAKARVRSGGLKKAA